MPYQNMLYIAYTTFYNLYKYIYIYIHICKWQDHVYSTKISWTCNGFFAIFVHQFTTPYATQVEGGGSFHGSFQLHLPVLRDQGQRWDRVANWPWDFFMGFSYGMSRGKLIVWIVCWSLFFSHVGWYGLMATMVIFDGIITIIINYYYYYYYYFIEYAWIANNLILESIWRWGLPQYIW